MDDKKQKIFWFCYGFIATLCVLIFIVYYSSLFVHASSPNSLPYYSTQVSEDNAWLLANINTIKNSFPNTPHILVVYEDTSYPNDLRFRVVNFPDLNSFYAYNANLEQINIEIFTDYRSDYFYTPNNTYYEQSVMRYYQGTLSKNYGTTNAFKGSLFGNHVLQNNITYCYPIYWDKDYSFNGVEVLKVGEKPLPPINSSGHATEPDFDTDNNINTDGHAQQPNTPTFPTFIPPTIDTTNLESLVTSLINFVKEFADFVGECFSTFFSWLVAVIQNAFQSLINTIREVANFLYENFISLFETIAENVSYIIEPLDIDEVSDAFYDTDFYTVPNSFITFTNTFDNAFNISEPDTFTITIHVEDIDLLNQTNPYVLNLGSQFYPIRSALRTFLWILVTFASVIFVEHNLSSWLKGSGEEK